MLAGMRLYVKLDGDAQHRLEQRAWGSGVKLQDLARRLLAEKLEEDERAAAPKETPVAEVA